MKNQKGDGGYINGGFSNNVLNKKVFDYISNDETIWEQEPLINLSKKGELFAFKHRGFFSSNGHIKGKNI